MIRKDRQQLLISPIIMSSEENSPNKKERNSSTNSEETSGSAGPSARTSSSATGGVETSPKAPDNWETVYSNIQEMRKDKTAAVDTMGCERAHDPNADPKV
jgi:hypothetical protein